MYLVAYDLNPKRDATDLINELKHFPGWSHYIDNVWMIITGETVQEVRLRLQRYLIAVEGSSDEDNLKTKDLLMIMHIHADAQGPDGTLPQAGWDWIQRSRRL